MKNLFHAHVKLTETIKIDIQSTLNKLTEFRFDIENKEDKNFFKNKYYQLNDHTKLKINNADYGFMGLYFVCNLFIIESEKHDICASFTAYSDGMAIYCINNLQIETVYSERNLLRNKPNGSTTI